MEVKVSLSVMFNSLRPHGLYRLWNSPGQNTGVGSLSLLQGIFPNQGSNPSLPHCRQILYQLSYKGSPRLLEWVAYPFSSGSSRPRNQTQVSCIAGGFFTKGAIKEALVVKNLPVNAGDTRDVGLIPGSEKSPGGGHGNPLQYSCLENPHGQRSLAGYSPYSHKESDKTEVTKHAHIG